MKQNKYKEALEEIFELVINFKLHSIAILTLAGFERLVKSDMRLSRDVLEESIKEIDPESIKAAIAKDPEAVAAALNTIVICESLITRNPKVKKIIEEEYNGTK